LRHRHAQQRCHVVVGQLAEISTPVQDSRKQSAAAVEEQARAGCPQVDKTGRGHAVIQADAIERASGPSCHQDEGVSPPVVRDRHCGPVPEEAWLADAEARTRGRVEIFNAIKSDGMDHWTMDVRQYELMRKHILDMLDDDAEDGTILLKVVVDAAQHRFARHELFPKGRVRNYCIFTKSTSKPAVRSNGFRTARRSASDGGSTLLWPLRARSEFGQLNH
jgi:hypothetical protein